MCMGFSMNITLSAEPALIAKVRTLAKRRGTSLNAMVRGYLKSLTEENSDSIRAAGELERLWRSSNGTARQQEARTSHEKSSGKISTIHFVAP